MRTLLDTQEDFEVVGDCGDPEEYRLLLKSARPDIVLMDLALGGDTDGVALTAHTRATSPSTAVLVFTTYDSDADFVRSLDAGASGYLLKDSTPVELFAAIRTARDGGSALSPAVASRLMDRMRAPQESLTPREIEVLALLATGRTNRQVGERLFVSETTVKTHVNHIFTKLGVDTRAAAVSRAMKEGLIRL
ncbi:LuxR family transcriptional regulator [Leifsonia xyli subsp. xyli]|nr:LuxR family transcriptional regulator [Leifsonia xyli subsp. xyli]